MKHCRKGFLLRRNDKDDKIKNPEDESSGFLL